MKSLHSLIRRFPFRTAALLAFVVLSGCSSSESVEAAGEAPPAILDLESFLTNISDPSGERYCKVTVKLAISPPEVVESIQGNPLLVARIRDKILTLVTSKTFLDLSDPEGKEEFREQLRSDLSTLLPKGQVDQVLFSEFVVQ